MQLNGVPVTPDELKTLALSNYGHFTSMRVEKQRVRGLALHLERLRRDCREIFDADLDLDYVRHLIRQVAIDAGPAVVRVTVFDPEFDFGHPHAETNPKILITTRAAADRLLPPLSLRSAVYARDLPQVKHVGLFATINLRRTAQLNGFDDVLFTDVDGFISEGATWNIGFFDRDQVIWPNLDCLQGVTMSLIQGSSGSTTHRPVNVLQLANFSGAFITNAAVGIRTVSAIDSTRWSDSHPLADILRKQYEEIPADLL